MSDADIRHEKENVVDFIRLRAREARERSERKGGRSEDDAKADILEDLAYDIEKDCHR